MSRRIYRTASRPPWHEGLRLRRLKRESAELEHDLIRWMIEQTRPALHELARR